MNNIQEGNKKIAEFMGGRFYKDTHSILEIHITSPSGSAVKCVDKLKYHTSWDWLMPVVEKIGLTGWISDEGQMIYNTLLNHLKSVNIEGVFRNAVKFIDWYNQLSPTK